MHIINAMFSRGLGGIEQSFVDYCEAIKAQGHKVTAIIHPDAEIRMPLIETSVNIINVKNFGQWDIFAKSYLKKILKQNKPDAIIAHGNRAVGLLKSPAAAVACPLIGVTHNYSTKRLIGLDAIFAITEDLKQKVIEAGQSENSVYKIPNMIHPPKDKVEVRPLRNPPIIGTMGRFVKKKGFDIFLKSIAELKERGVNFKAVIGGSGEEEEALKKLATSLAINDTLEFKGWINNKAELFDNIDIFCLPSLHEPFGIILLEAFMSGTAVITSDSEGPSEIATDGKNALIIPKDDYMAMANAIEKLINNPEQADSLAAEGLKTVKNYGLDTVGERICKALEAIIS